MKLKNRHAIVLTGGPASGKTELYQFLKAEADFSSFIFLEELARKLLIENPTYREHWHQFHLDIYQAQIRREAELGDSNFVTDRGTADTFAFHPETAQAVNTTITAEYARYTTVIQLGSAASLGKEYYQTDSVRNESIAEALQIETAIREVWQNHPGFCFFPAETDAKKKRRNIIGFLRSLIDNK